MPRKTISQRLANVPLAQKLGLIIAVLSLMSCALLALSYEGMDALSAVRAYVGAESLWSKGQKHALLNLHQYADTRDEAHYQRFLANLNVSLGDRIARLEMSKPDGDLSVVYQGFVQGGVSDEDVRGMVRLFKRFEQIGPLKETVLLWSKCDALIDDLLAIGRQMHAEIQKPRPNEDVIESLFDEALRLDGRLTPLENAFSDSLGRTARWLRRGLLISTLAATALFLAIGLSLAFVISRQLTGQIGGLRKAAVRAGEGDFRQHLSSAGADEIGDLSRAFQDMMDQREKAEQRNADLTQELEQRVTELRASNEELESFSYSVSHDLRAPLRAIDGFSQMLDEKQGERLDDEGRRLLATVRRNAGQMAKLIEGLLSFSRLSLRPLTTTRVNMTNLANDVQAELLMQEPRRDIRVEVQDLGHVQGDPTLLRQVFANLLGNAIKFTRHQPVAVITIGRREERRGNVYFVKDNGAGFDPRYADKLFGVFQRLHTNDEFEGTGVGLALVQRIVQRHGGAVWAEGEVGKGASFYFSLPAASV